MDARVKLGHDECELSRADLAEELGDLIAQMLALRFQRLRSLLDVVGRSRRRVGIGLHAGNVVGDVLGALRGKLCAARDLLGGGTLFLHRGGDRGGDLVDLADDRCS
jgi:class 3 adenylate cyclase